MREKFFIKALMVCLLLTLFSCSGSIKIERNGEGISPPATPTIYGYKQRTVNMRMGVLHEIITPKDTFLVFGRQQYGMVLLKQSPVK